MQDSYFASLSERLVKSGLEEKVFALLRLNMDSSSSSSFSGPLSKRMDSVMKEFGTSGNMVRNIWNLIHLILPARYLIVYWIGIYAPPSLFPLCSRGWRLYTAYSVTRCSANGVSSSPRFSWSMRPQAPLQVPSSAAGTGCWSSCGWWVRLCSPQAWAVLPQEGRMHCSFQRPKHNQISLAKILV